MSHRFIDIAQIPKKENTRKKAFETALIKIADVISAGKAAQIDCAKLERKPMGVWLSAKRLIENNEMPGITLVRRSGEIYLVRK